MITQTDLNAIKAAGTIADAVAEFLAPDGGLSVGEPLALPVELPLRHAVHAPLGGSTTGEISLFVDDVLAEALRTSELGALELTDALRPVFDAVAGRLGGVQLGVPQPVDARLALSRLEAQPDAVVIVLGDGDSIRAAVGVGLAEAPGATQAPAASQAARGQARGQAERLDLLRGVEMQATVELGRAKMTINDLLSLHDGAIIELDRIAGDAADLYVNGRLLARGEIVVVDENYALRVTQIVPDEQAR